MARTMCSDCNTRPVSSAQRGNGGSLCELCEDYAGWENTHNDYDHDGINDGSAEATDHDTMDMANCPVCHPELDPRNRTPRASHHNTAPRSWNSHAGCNHHRTPAARAACRKAGGPAGQETRPATATQGQQ